MTERLKRPLVEALAGEDAPGRVLAYVFGGKQRREVVASPHLGSGFMRVLQPANSPVGQWFEERVDLAKDYRQAFGENAPDPVQLPSRPTPTTPARAAAASSKGSRSSGGARRRRRRTSADAQRRIGLGLASIDRLGCEAGFYQTEWSGRCAPTKLGPS